MQHLDFNDTISIKAPHALSNETSMESNLSLIHSNYGSSPPTI